MGRLTVDALEWVKITVKVEKYDSARDVLVVRDHD